ncbi:universal stress protein [Pseudokordiimonas caeni]|uniref:universal stress protein n=1 Tax=Pseudokordiimonas caeni TaxID=2997908 RepID=UPI002811B7BF|nr:universal stress protein [Pseudokordiimonas caeni]
MTRILACIDASVYATSVADHAAWMASKLGAHVELLHAIQRKDAVAARHDLSGAVGLGAKSALLEELARIDEAESRAAQETGRSLLAAGEKHLKDAGLTDISVTHRHGGIVETILEREEGADFVVIGKRGASADFAAGHLGSKIERVVRASVKPVLVANRGFRPIRSVLIAYDGGKSAAKALEFVASSPLFDGTALHVVSIGETAEVEARAKAAAEKLKARHARVTAAMVPGHAANALVRYQQDNDCGLIVMGAYGHSPLRTMIVGSTTTEVIRACKVPVLLFR